MSSILTAPLAAVPAEAALKSMSSDLVFLLDKNNVDTDVQAKIGELGYTDVGVFSKFEDSADKVRAAFKADLGLDESQGARFRVVLARLINAWEAANARAEKIQEKEALHRVGDQPRTIAKADNLELIRAYEKVHAKRAELDDDEIPATSYLEKKLEEIEDGELEAEELKDVTSKVDPTMEAYADAKVVTGGLLRITRNTKSIGRMPTNPEELRRRFKLMGRCFEFMRIKFPGKGYVAGLTESFWLDYCDFILGKDVYGRTATAGFGGMEIRPSWNIVLTFEYKIRREAMKQVNRKGIPIVTAIEQAMKCPLLAQRYFSIPVAMTAWG